MNQPKQRVAVIGGGISGILAAYLLSQKHIVTLFEKNAYVGGHTNTVMIEDGPDTGTPIDTGFIVLNDRTYPTLHRFFEQLSVAVRWSDMSFGYYDETSGLQYAGTGWPGLFSQPVNLFRLSFLRILRGIRRFDRAAALTLEADDRDLSLGQFLRETRCSQEFIQHYVVPLGAAIWSAPDKDILSFPAQSFLRFFKNHGLLSLRDRPRWQTVVGGSHSYVNKFIAGFSGRVLCNSAVSAVTREPSGVRLQFGSAETEVFDQVVFANHADEALRSLRDPSFEERALLGAWNYQQNHTVLHTDISLLPPRPSAWASWNYRRLRGENGEKPVSVTYHMNRLQGLKTKHNYCVTLNARRPIPQEKILREFVYSHPLYTKEALASQPLLPQLNGKRRTWFCGSYFGFGFHEDAALSALEVARQFGIDL